MNAERRRRPRAVPEGGDPVGGRRGTDAEWVIRREIRGGREGFGVFLPSGEHIGFERDRRLLLDLLAGAGVSAPACQRVLLTLDRAGEARAGVFVAFHTR